MDEIDGRIVEAVRVDPRRSFADIAADVGLSADAVRVRIGKLIDDGELRIIGVLELESLGYRMLANVALTFAGDIAELVRALRRHDRVTFLASTIGRTNVLCEVAAADDVELWDFIATEIAPLPGVLDFEISRSTDVLKWKGQGWRPDDGVAGPADFAALDELDTEILKVLVVDPRIKVSRLAERLDRPYAVIRRKVTQLFDTGVVKAVAVTERAVPGEHALAVMHVQASDASAALPRLVDLAGVSIVSRTLGPHSGVLEIVADSAPELGSIIDRVNSTEGIVSSEVLLVARSHILPIPWRFRTM